jgi:ribulose-5-phosphate 4-epimerase/fuculose-1-phosphate aldolase
MSIDTISSAAAQYSESEWTTRVELAALFRIAHLYRMTDIANQAICARVQDEPDCFLVHPRGMMYDEVCASDLIKVRLDGSVLEGAGIWEGGDGSGFVEQQAARWASQGAVHLGQWIFGARPDRHFFIHGHCPSVQAVSATSQGLVDVSHAAIYLGHLVAYLDYDFEEDDEYVELFRRAIADHDILIARNHGYYTIGRHAAEAFFRAFRLREACSVQLKASIAAAGIGETLRPINPERVAQIRQQMATSEFYEYDGSTEWPALLRQLDRSCPEYAS